MTMHSRFSLLKTSPVRAILEALFMGAICWSILLLLQQRLASFIWLIGVSLCTGAVAVCWCALRLRLPEGSRRQQSLFEVVTGFVLSLALASMMLVVTLVLLKGAVPNALWRDARRPLLLAVIALALYCVVFLVCRVGIRLWLFWNRLRRGQLLWALTHAHVVVALLVAVLLLVVVEIFAIATLRDTFLVISTTLGLIVLSAIALIAIIPLSALFSYLVIRRTTLRVKTLASATSALRGGDYTVRIPVVGEDEVAQLQTNFNAMAGDLERSVRELQQERDRVAALLEARRELVANVSHELRTPVATLRSYLETTLSHWDKQDALPTLHRDLQAMEHEVQRLQALIEDLFTLARAEVGRLALQPQPTDVGLLIRHVVETAAPVVWRTSKIEIVAELPSELPPVLVDVNRLEQVLQNLLYNAVRHTSPGGIIALGAAAEPEIIALQVKDTGEGIAPEELARIWERFYQTEQGRMHKNSGAGLGLALVKEWIEEMGGSVAVESVVGEGSCFSIRLPRGCGGTPPH